MSAIRESLLSCPHCGHAQLESMPSEACVYFHACLSCGAIITPLPGDCCVFCSYGSVPCPPVQEQGKGCCAR